MVTVLVLFICQYVNEFFSFRQFWEWKGFRRCLWLFKKGFFFSEPGMSKSKSKSKLIMRGTSCMFWLFWSLNYCCVSIENQKFGLVLLKCALWLVKPKSFSSAWHRLHVFPRLTAVLWFALSGYFVVRYVVCVCCDWTDVITFTSVLWKS